MKKLAFLIFIGISFSLQAIDYPNLKPLPNIIEGKSLPNVKPVLGDFLYMAETEVTNQQYKIFLKWLKKNKPEEYNSNLPDTLKWRWGLAFNEPYVQYYFQHPAYNNYPVVNISQVQAINYCNWLHDSLEKYFILKKSKIDKFIVRLPAENEWIMAARGGLPETAVFPWEGSDIRRLYKGVSTYQLNCADGRNYNSNSFNHAFVTTEVYSYWPNGFGLYNMSGNVAEWVLESGKTKGGSWVLPPYNARIDVPGYHNGDTYAKPDIGFRYIIEIISVKNEFKPVVFNTKYFKKHFPYIPAMDTVNKNYHFAGETEVTNAEYNTFLNKIICPNTK